MNRNPRRQRPQRITGKPVIASLLLGAALLFQAGFLFAADPEKPNLIVVMVDDMGYAGVSCFGNPYFETPEIDRLAAEGMRLTDFHSSGTVCSPTRAGLLTGRYQQRSGIEAVIHPVSDHPEHRKGLQLSEFTFAEALKEVGYATGLIGKWHQGYPQNSDSYHPQNHGFDEFIGYHSGNIDFVSHVGDHYAHDWWHGKKETGEEGYSTHLINRYALDFVRRQAKAGKPFCLYVAHEAIHNPVQVPGDPVRRTLDGWDRWKWREVSKEERFEKYRGMTLPIDEGVGQLRDALVELGIEKNTLLLFFSDNGPSGDFPSGSPDLRGGKGTVYEGGHKVPAIAWWPGKITAGTESEIPLISIDVMPTLLALAGAKTPDRPLDGVDMSGVFLRGESLKPRPLYWASLSNGGARSEAMRDGPWKLVVQHPKAKPGTFDNEKVELFRLDKDPGEKTDLAAKEPEQAAKMLRQVKAWFADTEKTATPQPGGWIPKPKPDAAFFNGKDLTGWSAGEMKYWSVEDSAIVGHAEENVPRNEFLWSAGEVANFYLAVDVKLDPNNRNAGIQFRSKPVNPQGQALGYQADVGAGVWGKLYHEHGRGKLDWNDRAAKAVKPGEWNRYEILAAGHRIWTAINGTLCVAIEDPEGELSGKIAFQIHSGPPQDVRYRVVKMVHDPEIRLEKQTEDQLLEALPKKRKAPSKAKTAQAAAATPAPPYSPENRKGWTAEVKNWRAKVDRADPGIAGKWFDPDFGDSQWKTMSLPRHYEGSGLPGHDGTAWFRRTVDLPEALANKDLTLELGPIDDMDMTWVNGTQVGGIEVPGFWAKPRVYSVPAKLVRPGRNVFTVRVIDHGYSGGFAAKSAQAMKIHAAGKGTIPLHGNWRFHPGVTLKSLDLGELTNPSKSSTPGPGEPSPAAVPDFLRPLAKPDAPVPAFTEGFRIDADQTIAVFGGANAAECQRNGWLEARLVSAHPNHRVTIRNLAWPADTIYQQWRPRNFFSFTDPEYGERDGRDPIEADVVFLWFGQMESLDGKEKLTDFRDSYEALITRLSDYTGRIVLVTPAPFEDPLNLGFDLERRNADLARYAGAIRKIAAKRNLPVVDLSSALMKDRTGTATTDGALLSETGHQAAALTVAQQLGFPEKLPPNADYIREAIREKNSLWHRYWIPTNWAFLYGNRQTQPSSRDHTDPKKRWFPKEVKAILPAVEKLEREIREKVASE